MCRPASRRRASRIDRCRALFLATRKMTFTSSRRAAPASRTSLARASAMPAPPLPGSEKVKKMVPVLAKSGAIVTSSSPPWPRAATSGTPATGSETFPSTSSRMRPGRSVTIAPPSGRNSRPQGCCSPSAIVSALTGMPPASSSCVSGKAEHAVASITTAAKAILDSMGLHPRCAHELGPAPADASRKAGLDAATCRDTITMQ